MVSFTDGTDRSSIRTPYAIPAEAAGEWARLESVGAQCHPVCGRAWGQGVGSTGPVRAVAHPSPPGGSAERRTGTLTGSSNTSGKEPLVRIKPQAVARANPSGRVHPDGTGARQNTGHRSATSPARAGSPRGRGLRQRRERPGRSRCPRDRSRMRPRAVRCSVACGRPAREAARVAGPGGCRHHDLPAGAAFGDTSGSWTSGAPK